MNKNLFDLIDYLYHFYFLLKPSLTKSSNIHYDIQLL